MTNKQMVKAFWEEFEAIHKDLQKAIRNEDREALKELLDTLNDQLMLIAGCKCEVELADNGFYELTFDTGMNKTAQYICACLKKEAPHTIVDEWIINAFRQPLSERAMHTVLNIKGQQYTPVDFKIYYDIDTNMKAMHVQMYCEAFKGMDEVRQYDIARYLLELFIGELELEARIASLRILEAPIDHENVVLLPNFYEDICDIVIDQDWTSYSDPTVIYSVYKLNEEVKAMGLRKDITILATSNPILFEELQNQEQDSCRDFQDKGGEYGYCYYDRKDESEASAIRNAQIEKELHELLYPLGIARTIGSGIGTKHCYIDFAIFDKPLFLQALKRINEKTALELFYKSFTA
ncbi:MAG: hypothetical protein KH431_03220 [Erysipelotrichaceae bacterium]|nr:hypothetical protein [Erysipelotrichaceae bacterium]